MQTLLNLYLSGFEHRLHLHLSKYAHTTPTDVCKSQPERINLYTSLEQEVPAAWTSL